MSQLSFGSARELMFSAYAQKLAGKDETEAKMATGLLASISADTSATISEAQNRTSIGMVNTLAALKDLGVDMDSDFAKKIQAVNADILESFSQISKANASLVSQR